MIAMLADEDVRCPTCQAGRPHVEIDPHEWPKVGGLDGGMVFGALAFLFGTIGQDAAAREGRTPSPYLQALREDGVAEFSLAANRLAVEKARARGAPPSSAAEAPASTVAADAAPPPAEPVRSADDAPVDVYRCRRCDAQWSRPAVRRPDVLDVLAGRARPSEPIVAGEAPAATAGGPRPMEEALADVRHRVAPLGRMRFHPARGRPSRAFARRCETCGAKALTLCVFEDEGEDQAE